MPGEPLSLWATIVFPEMHPYPVPHWFVTCRMEPVGRVGSVLVAHGKICMTVEIQETWAASLPLQYTVLEEIRHHGMVVDLPIPAEAFRAGGKILPSM